MTHNNQFHGENGSLKDITTVFQSFITNPRLFYPKKDEKDN